MIARLRKARGRLVHYLSSIDNKERHRIPRCGIVVPVLFELSAETRTGLETNRESAARAPAAHFAPGLLASGTFDAMFAELVREVASRQSEPARDFRLGATRYFQGSLNHSFFE